MPSFESSDERLQETAKIPAKDQLYALVLKKLGVDALPWGRNGVKARSSVSVHDVVGSAETWLVTPAGERGHVTATSGGVGFSCVMDSPAVEKRAHRPV